MPIFINQIRYQSFKDIAAGLGLGYRFNMDREDEKDVLACRHYSHGIAAQISLINTTFNQVSKLFENLRGPQLPSGRIIVALSPIVFAWAANQKIENFYLRKFVNYTHTHIGNLSLAITLISSVGLIAIGQIAYGTSSLVYLGIGILDKYDIIPSHISKKINQFGCIIGITSGLVFGDLITKIFSIAIAASILRDQHLESVVENQGSPQSEKSESGKILLNWDEVKKDKDPAHLTIKRNHIHRKVLPTLSTQVNFEEIIFFASQFSWTEHAVFMNKKLQESPFAIEDRLNSFEDKIHYLQNGIQQLVERLQNKKDLSYTLKKTEPLTDYCQFLFQELSQQTKDMQIEILTTLGLAGKDPCGASLFVQIEHCYKKILPYSNKLSCEDKVLLLLQNHREDICYRSYNLFWQSNPINHGLGLLRNYSNVHAYHSTINIFNLNKRLGLSIESAHQDKAASYSPSQQEAVQSISSLIDNLFWNNKIQTPILSVKRTKSSSFWKFWTWYKMKREFVIIRSYEPAVILDLLNNLTIENSRQWWLDWIDCQKDLGTENDIQNYKSTLSNKQNPKLLDEDFLDEEGQVKIKFRAAMLIEMGVLSEEMD